MRTLRGMAGGGEGTWDEVRETVGRGIRHPLVRRFVRSGFLARGAVYAVVAALALALALGYGPGEATDTRGALKNLSMTPIGEYLLYFLGVALAGLALWFVVEALAPDVGPGGSRAWRVVMRVGNTFGAIGYGFMAFMAERLAFGARGGPPSDALAQTWTVRVLAYPGGRWLVFAVGAVVIGVGARQAWRGLARRFLDDLDPERASRRVRRRAAALGLAGFSVQGTVFMLVGVFFVWAAYRNDPRMVNGFDGVLGAIAAAREGSVLLAGVALGLFAYAAYSLVEGRYRRLR